LPAFVLDDAMIFLHERTSRPAPVCSYVCELAGGWIATPSHTI
jgi:hypothetical protein